MVTCRILLATRVGNIDVLVSFNVVDSCNGFTDAKGTFGASSTTAAAAILAAFSSVTLCSAVNGIAL
jgi:hypothetical protein